MTMYEELIKSLRSIDEYDTGYAKLIYDAADAIEELEICCNHLQRDYKALCNYLPKWIPVTKKPPEKDIPVFVYLFGDSPYIAWINHEGEWETEEFTIDRDYLPQVWMSLPEPPREEPK